MLDRAPRSVDPHAGTHELSDAFTEVAHHYDALVALNPGYHEHLGSSAQALLDELDTSRPLRLLDLGCGSGASTRALVGAVQTAGATASIDGVDASEGMLAAARAKTWPRWVDFRVGRAQELGEQGPDADTDGWDGVLAAYLVRNVPERDELIADLYRSLRPGGALVLHEYAVRGHRWATLVWTLVCWSVVIPLAAVVTRHSRLHRYLWRSVLDFDSIEQLQDRLHRAGFVAIRRRTFNNWQRGVLHTVVARRPEDG